MYPQTTIGLYPQYAVGAVMDNLGILVEGLRQTLKAAAFHYRITTTLHCYLITIIMLSLSIVYSLTYTS